MELLKKDLERDQEPISNYSHIERTDKQNEFVIKHQQDASFDRTCKIKWIDKSVYEWEGLPEYMREEVRRFKLQDLRKCPDYCLALVLQQAKDEIQSLRPIEELDTM